MRQGGWITVATMVGLVVLVAVVTASAASMGTAFTYQGRLEVGQAPANGSFDFEFRLYDAVTAGSQHGPTVTASAVVVADGWVTVELDFGAVFSGDERWLEIAVRSSGSGSYVTLSPRRELTATPNALWAVGAEHAFSADEATTAQQLGGHPAGDFLDTSSSLQIKEGRLVVGAASGSGLEYGFEAYGSFGGGRFKDSNGSGVAILAHDDTGVLAEGDLRGGYFENGTNASNASIAVNGRGIEAEGTEMGGFFSDSDSSGVAQIAVGGYGIYATGNLAGGVFEDPNDASVGRIGYGSVGVWAEGSSIGGFFQDGDNSSEAYVGWGSIGVGGYGDTAGGYFENWSNGNYAWLCPENAAISGLGSEVGAVFGHLGGGGGTTLATSDFGVAGQGGLIAGGQFSNADFTSVAYLGEADLGVDAYGTTAGGYFYDSDDSGYAYVGNGDYGVAGYGDTAGGFFQDLSNGNQSFVAVGTYKIMGSGTVSFVQNHPWDDSKVVVYHAPEASEVAVYTRGSGRLEDGRAVISLDRTFALVANPDLGLTAHLTAHGELVELAVESVSTGELVVIGPPGSSADFDYMVWALRIGFEESAPVQLKDREAYIPSMDDHRALYEAEPSLRSYNAFERFAASERELEGLPKNVALDLGRAEALKAAIHEFDPATDRLPDAKRPHNPDLGGSPDEIVEKLKIGATRAAKVRAANGGADGWSDDVDSGRDLDAVTLLDGDGNLDAPTFRAERSQAAVELPAVGGIAPGDVLAIDPDTGLLVPAASSGDLRVVGIAADDPGIVLGAGAGAGADPVRAHVVLSGLASCRVDAGYGAVLPGDLLIASPTPGHAMRAGGEPMPGSVVAKAMQPLTEGQGTIRVLVWLR